MTRWLFILLAVIGWFPPTDAHAHTRASQAVYDAGPPVAEVVLVAGITMDTDEGDNEDPLSLHKYLYCNGNPINLVDLSGLSPWGHHLIPRAVSENYSKRVRDIWDEARNRLDAKNYKLHNGKSYNKITKNDYAKAVEEKLDEFVKSKKATSADGLTDKELQEFANEIKSIRGGTIGEYNAGVAEEILEVGAEGLEGEEIYELIDIAYGIDGVAMDAGLIDLGL